MALVRSNHTAPLGLPGPGVCLGGIELNPGDNDVPDDVWAESKQNSAVQKWLSIGLITEQNGKKKV